MEGDVLLHLITYVADTFPLRWQSLETQDEPFNKIKGMLLIAINHGSTKLNCVCNCISERSK